MNAGQTVDIYQAPITGEEFEGRAQLIAQKHEDTGDGLSMWVVIFLDEPDNEYLRTVNTANANTNEAAL